MRRIAVLNDIHGNLPALEAVLDEVEAEGVDAIVCGGDLVSLASPYPAACLTMLWERGARFLTGNGEREVLAEPESPAAVEFTAWEREFIAGWPGTQRVEIEGLGRVLLCHGSPRSDEEILTVLTPDDVAAEAIGGADADVIVIGHTHHQFDRMIGDVRLVNAGSVGLPYEGRAGAFWAMIGPEVELRCTPYDFAAAVEFLRSSPIPGIDELLPESLLEPISAQEAAAVFERQAGRSA